MKGLILLVRKTKIPPPWEGIYWISVITISNLRIFAERSYTRKYLPSRADVEYYHKPLIISIMFGLRVVYFPIFVGAVVLILVARLNKLPHHTCIGPALS